MWALMVIVFLAHPEFVILDSKNYEAYADRAGCERMAHQIEESAASNVSAFCREWPSESAPDEED